MRISVIIPTFNRAYIVGDALRSAVEQTYRNFEVIVVDDGSNDGTKALVRDLGGDKVKLIVHERNRGYSAACNTGIIASEGEFIAFLNSDDLWASDYLERQANFLSRNPQLGGSFTDLRITGESLGWNCRPSDSDTASISSLVRLMRSFPVRLAPASDGSEHIIEGRNMYLSLLREVPIKPSALVVRRAPVVASGGFDEAWPSGTDWALFIKLSKIIEIGYIDAPLVVMRRTGDATHVKYREEDQTFLLKVLSEEKRQLGKDPQALIVVNVSIAARYNELARLALIAGRKRQAAKSYYYGFAETGNIAMIGKAAAAFLPEGARNALRSAIRQRSAS